MIKNPILSGFHPDPCICRSGEDYCIATSTFEWFPGVRIFHSRDLKHWRHVASPLNTVELADMKGNPDSGGIWAPALSYADGKFWLLYTDVKVVDAPWKNGRNYLITATDITGPWSKPIPMGNAGFDPSLFHHHDGSKYYVYRAWGPRNHSDPDNKIFVQQFDPDTNTLSKTKTCIFEGTELKYTEAPHLYHRNGYYYLFTAEGGTSFEHSVTVARSKSLLGPYEVSPNGSLMSSWHQPLNPLQKSGHASMVETQSGEWFITYLTSRPIKFPGRPLLARWGRGACPLGRETAIDKVEWQDDWPVVVGGGHAKTEIPEANLPTDNKEDAEYFHDNFENPDLSHHWQTLRIPFSNKLGSLTDQPGYLRLNGNDSLVSLFEQSTVATRWRHHTFSAETQLSFRPENFQQSAGLCCYYNTNNWSYCLIDYDEDTGQRFVRIIQVDQQVAKFHYYDEDRIEIPDDVENISIAVDVDGLHYHYRYSFDGKNWHKLNVKLESWKLSDDYIQGRGFFTGAFVGLHCEDISGEGCYADFSYFAYKPLEKPL